MQRTPFDIPDQMRDAVEKSVDQAKKAFDQFMEATTQAVSNAEGSAKSIRDGVSDVNRQAIAYLEENLSASFDLAHRLVRARSIEEVAAIQQQFMRSQMAAAAEQGKSLGDALTKAATDTVDRAKK